MKDVAVQQEESDLEKKRRDAEALLQSMGITSEAPVGMLFVIMFLLCIKSTQICYIKKQIMIMCIFLNFISMTDCFRTLQIYKNPPSFFY